MAHKLTTCTFCGVGCGLYLETSGNQVVGAYPSVSHPTNAGRICVRGWHVHEVASSPDRLKSPLIRKNGQFCEASWDEALGFIAARMKEIRGQYGPDALAFLNSPRCSNEEAYLLQKFARAVIGTNNVHHGTGVYCNNSINVLLDMIGVPASTNSIAELAESEVIVVDGVDLARRLPTLGGAVIRAKLGGARLMVVGTRRHRVAENADLFLQIKPNTEALLYGAMAKIIVDRGLMDLGFIKTRCRDYEPFLAQVSAYDLLQAAEGCGVKAELIEAAALTYARAKAAALLYSSSMEERTRDSIRAVVNLALLTGNLGKPGAGVFALTEQNNLQGVCDMGMLPDRLPGYEPVTSAAARAALEAIWGSRIPAAPGTGSRSVLTDRGQGKVRALWLSRHDPTNTASLGDIGETLRQFELVVVQHLFMTDISQYAHVVLPTTAFGEEEVSFTSTERRIQLAEKVIDPPAGLTPGWEQITHLARLMGADWHYRSAAEVMDEICDAVPLYGGASYQNLTREYGRQWPCTKDRPLGTPFLFGEDGDGPHFRFVAVAKPQPAIRTTKDFPLCLVFGNSLYYWNQNVLVRHSETLKREYRSLFLDYPEGFVELNPDDAKQLKVRDGDKIRLCVENANAIATARVTPEIMIGTVFVPHFMREVESQILGSGRSSDKLAPARVEKEAA
ncbi:MAG TPA: molybdopterin-dependent oxidoreductase [Terriglobales bacterium]|jgi:predicted molibdopterin-dependent oxidoreductase YjgC|nr:molybdopterin-dependent oxidoreductase [Terriglobales bacterium]